MTGGAVSLQHAVAVAEDFDAVMAIEAAAFGIGDALISLQEACSARAASSIASSGVTSAGWKRSRSGASNASSSLSATPA